MDDRILLRCALATFLLGMCGVQWASGPREAMLGTLPREGAVRVSGIVVALSTSGRSSWFTVRDATGEGRVVVVDGIPACTLRRGALVTVVGDVSTRGHELTIWAREVTCSAG